MKEEAKNKSFLAVAVVAVDVLAADCGGVVVVVVRSSMVYG
jgi:hypothetical protein